MSFFEKLFPRRRTDAPVGSRSKPVAADASQEHDDATWNRSQDFELNFWMHEWPHRHLSRDDLVTVVRAGDARWFLTSFGFSEDDGAYEGFEGAVLEVGCGPIGFFESVKAVSVKGIDSLMRRYAEAIPFSRFGKVNNYEYTDESIAEIKDRYKHVVCSNVLDHTADWKDFLRYLVHPLEPKRGELLLFTHSRSKVAPGHTQLFSPADLFTEVMKQDVKMILFKVLPHDSAHADYDCYVRCRAK